ncbi:hypothetical protein [Salipaludibacillus aurantiacus]|uniref:DUF4352 domain-containing protein n=1 Tax=Salipaludibacillus aurantiacus TaxID=1601833 RepID=A0A1H9SGJ5_9BACI|nr:hypothetical protein [Salipaludibacillus aurantiacus]SER84018.1 hypothetical protein SAMN05518684_104207 [Salipaludibacillus aurantiacus]
MKKLLTALSLSTLLVVACGDENTNTELENNDNNNAAEEVNNDENLNNNENTNENHNEEENEENNLNENNSNEDEDEAEEAADDIADESWETQVGDTIETDGGTFTLHARQDQIDTIETGPIVMEIEQLNTASGELTDDLADFMETDHLEYIQMDLVVENTADEDITFFSGQATMSTSTGEQIESDMWMSDHIDGELMAGTRHDGSFFFILENSQAEDVESVRITWSAPMDMDWEDVGEPVDIEVEF